MITVCQAACQAFLCSPPPSQCSSAEDGPTFRPMHALSNMPFVKSREKLSDRGEVCIATFICCQVCTGVKMGRGPSALFTTFLTFLLPSLCPLLNCTKSCLCWQRWRRHAFRKEMGEVRLKFSTMSIDSPPFNIFECNTYWNKTHTRRCKTPVHVLLVNAVFYPLLPIYWSLAPRTAAAYHSK